MVTGLDREARSVLRVRTRGSDTATATATGHRLTFPASVATMASASASGGLRLVDLPAMGGAVTPPLGWGHASRI